MKLRKLRPSEWRVIHSEFMIALTLNQSTSFFLTAMDWELKKLRSWLHPQYVGTTNAQTKKHVWLFEENLYLARDDVRRKDFDRYRNQSWDSSQYWKLIDSKMKSTFGLREEASIGIAVRDNRHIPQWIKIVVSIRDGGRCVYCGESDPTKLEFDHRKSWAKGGSSKDENNICLGCRTCNRKKGMQDWGWG